MALEIPRIQSMTKIDFHENIARRLVFVDGVTRSGKSLFSGILSSLERAEHIQFFTLIEYLIPAVKLGFVKPDYAKALLRITLNELAYNMRLSRNVNFRPTDQTGIANYKDPGLYRKRLNRKEGDGVVEELRRDKRWIPFQTHDLLVNLDTLNAMDLDYRMIQLFRHPVDNIYSWWRTGWGDRFGKDPRAFTLSLQHKQRKLPWYCAGYESEWIKLNPVERCVRTVLDLLEKSVRQYKKSSYKQKILLMCFEDFVQSPRTEMARLCRFLETRPTRHTPRYLKAARCPRVLDLDERENKESKIKNSVSKSLYQKLQQASRAYEQNIYSLKPYFN